MLPNPEYMAVILEQQFGMSGSPDSVAAVLWNPNQAKNNHQGTRHVSIGSRFARGYAYELAQLKDVPLFPSANCPWKWLLRTYCHAIAIAWCQIGYIYLFNERQNRGKAKMAGRGLAVDLEDYSLARCSALAQQMEEEDDG